MPAKILSHERTVSMGKQKPATKGEDFEKKKVKTGKLISFLKIKNTLDICISNLNCLCVLLSLEGSHQTEETAVPLSILC